MPTEEEKKHAFREWYEGLHAATRHVMTLIIALAGVVGAWKALDLPIPATRNYVANEIQGFGSKLELLERGQIQAKSLQLITKLTTLELRRTIIQSELFQMRQIKIPSGEIENTLVIQRRIQNLERELEDLEREIHNTRVEINK